MASRFDNPEEVLRTLRTEGRRYGWLIGVVAVLLLIAGGVWSSVYTVEAEGEAVIKRFGRVVGVAQPGLHFKLPFGIDTATFVPTQRVKKLEFGFRTRRARQRSEFEGRDRQQDESLMLTGDLNVVDVKWVVQYRISDPVKWLHRVRNPEETFRDISESVMRQVVGNRYSADVLTVERSQIASEARQQMQRILHAETEDAAGSYQMGVHINSVELQEVNPPDPVKPAFNAVNEARQKKQQLINEAERQRNQKVPRARGEAEKTISEAEGDAARRINRAKGEVAQFTKLYQQYKKAPEVTRRRLHLETLERVLPAAGRVYVIDGEQRAPLPLLNLEDGGRSLAAPKREGGGR